MEPILVTVVLPIYNVEKYLDRCIESVVGQTYQNLEILLIDDGSPDNCPQMCDEWAKKDNRIRVIHKANAGLGEARNTGIENATGSYICFFDSDDYIHRQTIEKCVDRLTQENADVVVFGLSCVDEAGKVTASYPPQVGFRTYRGNEVRDTFLPEFVAPVVHTNGTRKFYMSAWVMLYSVKLIRNNHWHFVSERNIISEDVYSILDLFQYVNVVTVLPEELYYYCKNDTSLSSRYVTNRYHRIRHFYEETVKLCNQIGYTNDIIHGVSKPYLAFTLSALKQEIASQRPIRQRFQTMKEIIADDVLQKVLYQNKADQVSRNRAIMFFCMRWKIYPVCFLLLKLKG